MKFPKKFYQWISTAKGIATFKVLLIPILLASAYYVEFVVNQGKPAFGCDGCFVHRAVYWICFVSSLAVMFLAERIPRVASVLLYIQALLYLAAVAMSMLSYMSLCGPVFVWRIFGMNAEHLSGLLFFFFYLLVLNHFIKRKLKFAMWTLGVLALFAAYGALFNFSAMLGSRPAPEPVNHLIIP